MRPALAPAVAFAAGVVSLMGRPAPAAVKYHVVFFDSPDYASAVALGVAGGQEVGVSPIYPDSDSSDALLWTGTPSSAVKLNPANYFAPRALATDGAHQVGFARPLFKPVDYIDSHAILWSGSPSNFVDLNPTYFTTTQATALYGNQQVGSGSGVATGNKTHALLWNGAAADYVDLNSAGFLYSAATGISGGHQVGYASVDNLPAHAHAMLWSGSDAGAVDLTPAGFASAQATGIDGHLQVGFGTPTGTPAGPTHALLWSDTAGSAVDLNPLNFASSQATAVAAGREVGFGVNNLYGRQHALLWNGAADAYVDLHLFLPGIDLTSAAYGIDAAGDVVGSATDAVGITRAVEWVPVAAPEPASAALLGLCGAGLLARRRRRGAGAR